MFDISLSGFCIIFQKYFPYDEHACAIDILSQIGDKHEYEFYRLSKSMATSVWNPSWQLVGNSNMINHPFKKDWYQYAFGFNYSNPYSTQPIRKICYATYYVMLL